MKHIRRLLADKAGATMIEYGLIAALIGVVIISALAALGPAIETQFMAISTKIAEPTP